MYWMFASMVSTRFSPGSGWRSSLPSTWRLRIERSQHAAGRAVQLVVELVLQAAEPVVVGADVAQHLRGNSLSG